MTATLFAQYHELGVSGGVSYYTGDIYTKHFQDIREQVSLFYRLTSSGAGRWNLTVQLQSLRLAGDDAKVQRPLNQQRQAAFRTWLLGGQIMAEFNFLPFSLLRSEDRYYDYTPFLQFGVGVSLLGARTAVPVGGQLVFTPVQEIPPDEGTVGSVTFLFPIGLGMKFKLAPSWGMGVTYTLMIPTSPYIDGVHLAGNRGVTDLIYTLNLQLFYAFKTSQKGCNCLKKRR